MLINPGNMPFAFFTGSARQVCTTLLAASVLGLCLAADGESPAVAPGAVAPSAGVEALPTVPMLLETPSEYADHPVTFEGLLVGCCKHGGKKGFFKDADGAMPGYLRVDIGGEAKPFTREDSGELVRVTGRLVEKRIDAAALDRWEAMVRAQAEKADEGAPAEKHDCPEQEQEAKALETIQHYRAKLAASPKGYLSSYSFVASGWEIVTDSAQ